MHTRLGLSPGAKAAADSLLCPFPSLDGKAEVGAACGRLAVLSHFRPACLTSHPTTHSHSALVYTHTATRHPCTHTPSHLRPRRRHGNCLVYSRWTGFPASARLALAHSGKGGGLALQLLLALADQTHKPLPSGPVLTMLRSPDDCIDFFLADLHPPTVHVEAPPNLVLDAPGVPGHPRPAHQRQVSHARASPTGPAPARQGPAPPGTGPPAALRIGARPPGPALLMLPAVATHSPPTTTTTLYSRAGRRRGKYAMYG